MLYELIGNVKTLSVIGMCKNAGKTTVLNSMIGECEMRGETLGLTSIGRDGERSDLVTNTKKPEIYVREGAVIATAEGLLRECDVSREILAATGIPSPMGEIIVFRARSSGYVQIGGASITEHQKGIRDMLFGFGCTRVFIDGAISRKSLGNPSLADGVVLSSGASYDADINKTVADTAYIAKLFALEETGTDLAFEGPRYEAVTGTEHFAADELSKLLPVLKKGAEALILRGAVTDGAANELNGFGKLLKGTELVSQDASRLLLKPSSFEKLMRFAGAFRVLRGTRLLAVTVNPFSAYGLHYDRDEFYNRVCLALGKEGVTAPVMDVKNA